MAGHILNDVKIRNLEPGEFERYYGWAAPTMSSAQEIKAFSTEDVLDVIKGDEK